MKIAVTGHIQTGSYTNRDGNKVYTTDVIVDSQEFVESKSASQHPEDAPAEPKPKTKSETKTAPTAEDDDFMNIDDGIESEMPFR